MEAALLPCSPSRSCPSAELSSTQRSLIFTSHASDFGCFFTRDQFAQVWQRVTKAGDVLWFPGPLLWWRLERHQVSNVQSTALERDEKLDSSVPLEWDIVSTLGCGDRNFDLGMGRKAVSCGGPWAMHHPRGSPTATRCNRDRPWGASSAETEMLSNDWVSSDFRKQGPKPNPSTADLLRLKSKSCRKLQSVLRHPPSGKTGSGFGVN